VIAEIGFTFMGLAHLRTCTSFSHGQVVKVGEYVRAFGSVAVRAEVRVVNSRITSVYVEWSELVGGKHRATAWLTTKTVSEMRRALVERGHSVCGAGGAA
jgi:hypothetical protein